jgi:hypothetical protein
MLAHHPDPLTISAGEKKYSYSALQPLLANAVTALGVGKDAQARDESRFKD